MNRLRRGERCHLSNALMRLLPGLSLQDRKQTDWHSATFAGVQLNLRFHVPDGTLPETLERFVSALPEHEFSLPGHIVADIAVRDIPAPDQGEQTILCIDALILRDD